MKKRIAVSSSLLVLLASCLVAFAGGKAQSQGKETLAAPPSTTGAQEKNLQEYIALLRADVRQQKTEIMGAVMALDADQAAKFWPVYSEYDAELTKLNDLRVANIREYARTYDQMTDAKADQLIQNAFSYRKLRSELLAKYYERVKASLGAIQAARFLQIEDQLLMIIDLQIAAELPIAKQGS